jgi:uncharacterized protein YdaU (DUF1376 family)
VKKKLIEMDARPLFQKWSESDFLMKTTVEKPMHWLARLFYRGLLQRAFICETRPNLPDNDADLRILLGGVPEDEWAEHQAAIRAWFTPKTINGVKVLIHKRLQEDWQLLLDYREEQRVKGQKSGEARRRNRTAVEPGLNHGSSPVEPEANQEEIELEIEPEFETESETESQAKVQTEKSNSNLSFAQSPSDGMNDSPYLSAKDDQIRQNIKILSLLFHAMSDDKTFRAGPDQVPRLTALIDEHGMALVVKSVERFAQDDHRWDLVGCPAGLYLENAAKYIRDAKEDLEAEIRYEKERASRQARATQ